MRSILLVATRSDSRRTTTDRRPIGKGYRIKSVRPEQEEALIVNDLTLFIQTLAEVRVLRGEWEGAEDRKSTRLNSSH